MRKFVVRVSQLGNLNLLGYVTDTFGSLSKDFGEALVFYGDEDKTELIDKVFLENYFPFERSVYQSVRNRCYSKYTREDLYVDYVNILKDYKDDRTIKGD